MNKPLLIKQKISARNIKEYKKFIRSFDYQRLNRLAESLKGKTIVYVNSTPNGGGVAELLKNIVPLQKDLGLNVHWCAFDDNEKFFRISKKLHNSLQGSNEDLSKSEKDYYISHNKTLADQLLKLKPDVVLIQDPQPLGIVNFLPDHIRVICRIHIDLTEPNIDSLKFIEQFLRRCDKIVFTMKSFAPDSLDKKKIIISPPAIDPLAFKNEPLTSKQVRAVAEHIGVNLQSPLLAQVSRFDKWKDPEGVVQVYRLVKQEYPEVQLLLMGIIEAQDDPEAISVYENVKNYVGLDPNVFLISDKSQLFGIRMDTFVNAVQRMSDVIMQKSIREGFGLTVSEAMWKGKPVIGGDVGGIRLQIENKKTGFLVNSIKEAADIAVNLISNKKLAAKIGQAAKIAVGKRFLITRYIGDEMETMVK